MAIDVWFEQNMLCVQLSDGRTVSLPLDHIPWLSWLHKATPEQQANWSLEPGGYTIYWEDLDDGIEVAHLLLTQSLA